MPRENAPKNGMQRQVKVEPIPNPSPNLNLNQQLGEIAPKNVLERHVEDKRIWDNVLKGLQISAKKPVGERKNQRRKKPKEGGKEERYFD